VVLDEREGLVLLKPGVLIEPGDSKIAGDSKGSMTFHKG
jgi:hypothetical protein